MSRRFERCAAYGRRGAWWLEMAPMPCAAPVGSARHTTPSRPRARPTDLRCGASTETSAQSGPASSKRRWRRNHSMRYPSFMLNAAAFTILANSETLSDRALRLLLRLISDYDLRQYRIVPAARLKTSSEAAKSAKDLQQLLTSGLLEMRPMANAPAYRVAPRFLLSHAEIAEMAREDRERWEREQLMPESATQ